VSLGDRTLTLSLSQRERDEAGETYDASL
jgi:hypothetical protein